LDAAPTYSDFLTLEYPVITTSVKSPELAFKLTVTALDAPRLIVEEPNPTPETTSCLALAGTFKEKEPSAFVVVPVLLPLTNTDAPEIGAPFSSVTFPVIVLSCAHVCTTQKASKMNRDTSFLILKFV